jgi:hypothetical protein
VELVVGMVALGIVVAIAAAFVIREAGRIAKRPPPALFDPDDAFEWVVENVPDDVAATLTPEDVRRILEFQLEFFERKGVSGTNGSSGAPIGPVVVGGAETVAYILDRAEQTGDAYLPDQVHAVIETQYGYLRTIGALGPAVDDDLADPDDGRPTPG